VTEEWSDRDTIEMEVSFSLSGITRTGSMGLISACNFKAPLILLQRYNYELKIFYENSKLMITFKSPVFGE
jgi:hypothetical protein